MSVDTSTASLMLSTAVAVPSIMGAFVESPAACALGPADPDRLAELRRGELIGAAISLALALTLASAVESHGGLILALAVVMVGANVAEHERALRAAPHTSNAT